jgi:hypothetical protein
MQRVSLLSILFFLSETVLVAVSFSLRAFLLGWIGGLRIGHRNVFLQEKRRKRGDDFDRRDCKG